MNNTSPQYTRTHNAICYALIRLLHDKPFEQITVQHILDATPVTRTTFYKHFRDKYEVAEVLQAQFFQKMEQMIAQLNQLQTVDYSALMSKYIRDNRELVEALSKIHTEQVDLQTTLASYMKTNYLALNHTPYSDRASEVYAKALTTYQLYNVTHMEYLKDVRVDYNEIMLEAFLNIFNLQDDDYLRDYIMEKLNQ